jgi:hypothetical protein
LLFIIAKTEASMRCVSVTMLTAASVDDEPAVGGSLHYAASEQF